MSLSWERRKVAVTKRVTGTADSIYRYDRDALLAALKQARMGKTA